MIRVAGLLVLFLVLLTGQVTKADSATINDFVGCDLRYQVGFLWMDHVADASFTVEQEPEPGVYRARLTGRTRGFTAWLTKDRVQTYETRMRLRSDGHLETLAHESLIDKGSDKKRKRRSKYYHFDEKSHQVLIEKRGDGKVMWNKQIPVTQEPFPVDILTAFFNFATGAYGPLEKGKVYNVPAFSGEGVGMIRIDIVSPEDAPGSLSKQQGLVCRVQVDQEVFDTQDGVLYVQFDSAMRPVRGVIKDIIGLGDIRGTMR